MIKMVNWSGGAQVWALLAFVLLMAACNSLPPKTAWTQTNHPAVVYTSADSCEKAVALPATTTDDGFAEDAEFGLLSWNIHKGAQPGWRADLKKMASGTQLILLQEAVLADDMKNPLDDHGFWSFSPGYQGNSYSSGVMTVSPVAPDIICSLQTTEPWLNTPKAASVVRFPIKNSRSTVLLVNMHAINFSLGIDDFRKQVDSVAKVMAAHDGPIILSGDFNTWRDSRLRLLTSIAKRLGLAAVEFKPDHRTQWFGNYLDYIFVRGFTVKKADIPEVTSSDHNPLKVTLVMQKNLASKTATLAPKTALVP